MRNGRPPKPIAIRKLHGNPSGKPLDVPDEPASRGPLMEPPEWFDEEQREKWQSALAAAPYGLLTMADAALLAAWCVAVVLHKRAVVAMRETGGPVVTTRDGNLVQNPWLAIQNRQALIALKCASEMGFTPTSRAVLAARMHEAAGSFATGDKRQSPLDKYLRENPDRLDN